MPNSRFYGRKDELDILLHAIHRKIANFIVVKGRRRIGKTRLLDELVKHVKKAYFFAGIAPTVKTTAQSQREEFARQLSRTLGIPPVKADNWGDLFWFLAEHSKVGQILIIFDEITWMGSEDPDFLGQLKHAWDSYFKKNPECTIVICGSMSVWIEKNILSSTGFLGRPTLDLTLKELPLNQCTAFWQDKSISAYESLKIFAITGGVPRYLELIDPKLTAEKNIQQLCFSPEGMLFQEFEKIFSDLFDKRGVTYKNIMNTLIQGAKSQTEIIQVLAKEKSGRFGDYLEELVLSGFIRKTHTWTIKTGKESKKKQYRICDNYSRFYLKYIFPQINKIQAGAYRNVSLSTLPGWYSILGLQFESLVINNRDRLLSLLHLKNEEILYDGSYFQSTTHRQAGCQIDYLIQTHTYNLYVIEIKFSKNKIKKTVINEVHEKIQKISVPRNMSVRPVLLHVNGVEKAILESDFFIKIIDFSAFL
jgi:uncharacterized protein